MGFSASAVKRGDPTLQSSAARASVDGRRAKGTVGPIRTHDHRATSKGHRPLRGEFSYPRHELRRPTGGLLAH